MIDRCGVSVEMTVTGTGLYNTGKHKALLLHTSSIHIHCAKGVLQGVCHVEVIGDNGPKITMLLGNGAQESKSMCCVPLL